MAAEKPRNTIHIEYDQDTKEIKCRVCDKWRSNDMWISSDMICTVCGDGEIVPRYERKKVPKMTLEYLTQATFRNSATAKCGVNGCYNEISISGTTKFVIGHDIAVKYGGTNSIENLRLICRVCNERQGTLTFEKYEEKLMDEYLQKEPNTQQHIKRFLEKYCESSGTSHCDMLFCEYTHLSRDTWERYELDCDKFVATILELWPYVSRDVNTLEGISLRKKALYEN